MSEKEKKRLELQSKISAGNFAVELDNHPEFKWYYERRLRRAQDIIKEVMSGKYLDDNAGYARAIGEFQALKRDNEELSYVASKGLTARQDLERIDNA